MFAYLEDVHYNMNVDAPHELMNTKGSRAKGNRDLQTARFSILEFSSSF